MVERITGPTPVPSLRNCTGRHPDGDTVPQPAAEPAPPATFAERAWAAVFVVITLAAMVVGAVVR